MTLFQFYRSKEWRSLLIQLRQERLDSNGFVTCEYCGKPIVKAYDMIGHHKQELTEENVDDYDISLNPDNVQFVHHRCHNYIHNKLGRTYRGVYLVYGSPLSGKSTWVHDNAEEGDLILDIDRIWACVSGLEEYRKPPRLNAVVFKIRDTILDCVKYRLGRWNNAYIIGGYPLQSERERLTKELNAQEIYIDTPREICEERLETIDDARDKEEWSEYIKAWWSKYSPPSG